MKPTLDDIRTETVGIEAFRISAETLEMQAKVAEQHANAQLAGNFRRAAELTLIPDAEVLAIYEALRPRRSTLKELTDLAANLDTRGAALNAAFIREASKVYEARNLLR